MIRSFALAAVVAIAGAAPATAQSQTWPTFNGDLKAQKYSTETAITPANVHELREAWQMHTGDVSDGSGGKPKSVWSATPLFVNDTLYLGTPFYRIFALEPDTGKIKWTYDAHAVLKGLTQPELKSRGVAYWQAEAPQAGQSCQKIVYIGTMDAKLHAVDGDTGKLCAGFAKGGILDIDQWNKPDARWPQSILQPPTVYKNTLFIGWAGKDWANKAAPAGTVYAVDAQDRRAQVDLSTRCPRRNAPRQERPTSGASMSVDPEAGLLSTCRSALPARTFSAATAPRTCRSPPRSRPSTPKPARWFGAASSSITICGISTPTPLRFSST